MPTKAPKVIFGGNYRTSQIYSQGFEFAFMSQQKDKKGKAVLQQACPFVYCKDFLHDAIWAQFNKKSVSIYGFKYDPKKNLPLATRKTILAFRNDQYKSKEKEFHGMLDNCLEFLQSIDRVLGFRPTQIHKVEHPDGSPTWIVIGDKRWQHAPTMISLYTLLIRLGCFHKLGDDPMKTLDLAEKGKIKIGSSGYAGNNDSSYVKQGRKGIDVILKHGIGVFYKKQADNYPAAIRSGLHDNYGIVNFTAKTPEDTMPFWYREEIWQE